MDFADIPEYEIHSRDIVSVSPATTVLRMKKDLGLDDKQVSRLEEVRNAFAADARRWADDIRHFQQEIAQDPPYITRLPDRRPRTHKDSVSRAKKDSSNIRKSDRYLEALAAGRRGLGATMLSVQSGYIATLTTTKGILTDQQREMVKQPLDSAASEFILRLRHANIR